MALNSRLAIATFAVALPLSSFAKDLAPISTVNGLKLKLSSVNVSLGEERDVWGATLAPSQNVVYGAPQFLEELAKAQKMKAQRFQKYMSRRLEVTEMENKLAANLDRAQAEIETLGQAKKELSEIQESLMSWQDWLKSPTIQASYPTQECIREQTTGFCRQIDVAPGRQLLIEYGHRKILNPFTGTSSSDFSSFHLISNKETKLNPVLEIHFEKSHGPENKEAPESIYSGVPVFMRASCEVWTIRTTINDLVPVAVPFVTPTRELRCTLPEGHGEVRFTIIESGR